MTASIRGNQGPDAMDAVMKLVMTSLLIAVPAVEYMVFIPTLEMIVALETLLPTAVETDAGILETTEL